MMGSMMAKAAGIDEQAGLRKGRTYVREVADGYELVLDGVKVDTTFNSRGAARAAIDVERRRRAKRNKEQ